MDRLQFLERSYTRESLFSYDCHACRRCCHDKIIRVNPYEVGRLARNRQMGTTEFLSHYTTANGTTLKHTEEGACVFLTAEGCGVHADRPLVCRLYPLGRRVTADGEETFHEVKPHPQTEGTYGTRGTVQDFLSAQGAEPFIDAVDRYVALISRTAPRMITAIRDNDLRDDVKQLLEGIPRCESRETPSWLDMDRAVTRYCEARHRPVPGDIETKMELHLLAIEDWIGHLPKGGDHDRTR
jgi:Fe-S-cluster containining protein